jgi:hypothetical protein
VSALRNITFRKFTAFVLLALMLVIHGVKFFHHHSIPVLSRHTSHDSLVTGINKPVHHCTICDFKLTRDANIAIVQFSFQAIQPVVESCSYYVASHYEAYSSHVRLRGPPVTA